MRLKLLKSDYIPFNSKEINQYKILGEHIKYRKNKQVEVKGMRRIRKRIKRSFAMYPDGLYGLTSFKGSPLRIRI